MKRLGQIVAVIGLSALAGACASVSGKTPDRPDLVVPPPPPRVIPINSEPIAEPVPELPSAAGPGTSRAPARPPAPRPSAEPKPDPKANEAKPDAKPAEAPPPEPAPPVAPPAAAPQLRTTESSAAEASARGSIERTRNLLQGIDYGRLSNARKKAYEEARRFAQQAEDALKAGNAVFAQNVATKAETLARQLSGG